MCVRGGGGKGCIEAAPQQHVDLAAGATDLEERAPGATTARNDRKRLVSRIARRVVTFGAGISCGHEHAHAYDGVARRRKPTDCK